MAIFNTKKNAAKIILYLTLNCGVQLKLHTTGSVATITRRLKEINLYNFFKNHFIGFIFPIDL